MRIHTGTYPTSLSSYSKIFPGVLILFVIVAFSVYTALGTGIANWNGESVFKYDEMLKCVDDQCPQYAIVFVLCLVVFIGFFIFYRYFPMSTLLVTVIILISSTPFILKNKFDNLFEYLKYYSMFIGFLFLLLLRLGSIFSVQKQSRIGYFHPTKGNKIAQWMNENIFHYTSKISENAWTWVLYVILMVNIGEAGFTDFSGGNYYNFAVAILLILTMPRPGLTLFNTKHKHWKNITLVTRRKPYDLIYDTTLFWVLMYTSWDACFAYAERREHFFVIVIVLLAALLTNAPLSLGLIPFLYIQARTSTLLSRYAILGYEDVYQKFADTSNWYNEDVKKVWEIANVSIFVVYIVYYLCTTNKAYKKLV